MSLSEYMTTLHSNYTLPAVTGITAAVMVTSLLSPSISSLSMTHTLAGVFDSRIVSFSISSNRIAPVVWEEKTVQHPLM